jgi:hypothetical protein
MIGLMLAAGLASTTACPSIAEIVPTAEAKREAESWLRKWAMESWKRAGESRQQFRISVSTPFDEPNYEVRAWRTSNGWRVLSRQTDGHKTPHAGALDHPDWQERVVDPAISARIDAIWNNACLWSTPRIRLDPSIGSKVVVPKRVTTADRVGAGIISFDLESGRQVWLGYQAITAGFPAELAKLALNVARPD